MTELIRALPLPTFSLRQGRDIRSRITRLQVAKILPLLRSPEDREAVTRMFIWWNSLDCKLQMIHTAESHGDDFFEISLFENGVTICVSIYKEDEDCIFLRIDPDCDLVIREVPL